MENVEAINSLYGGTLVSLMREMKLSAAHQKINEFTNSLLEVGYSRQELLECMNVLLKEEA